MKKFGFCLMVAVLVSAFGCSGDFPMAGDQPSSDGAPAAGVPFAASEEVLASGMERSPTTIKPCRLEPTVQLDLLRKSWSEAERQFQICQAKALEREKACQAQGGIPELCDELQQWANSRCMYERDMSINSVPLILCDTQIIRMTEGVNPDLYHDREGVIVHDPDGDGLNTYLEYVTGLDPCSQRSFQHCPVDGEVDSDGDGLINKEDPFPYCHKNVAIEACASR